MQKPESTRVKGITRNALRDYPDYVKRITATHYEIDPDLGFPLWLYRFGLEADQYGVEIALKACIREVLECAGRLGNDMTLFVRVRGSKKWRIQGLPPGKGTALGHRDFRRYWNHWKGIVNRGLVVVPEYAEMGG